MIESTLKSVVFESDDTFKLRNIMYRLLNFSIFILAAGLLVIPQAAFSQADSLKKFNGLFEGGTILKNHTAEKFVAIQFLSDSSFAFTMDEQDNYGVPKAKYMLNFNASTHLHYGIGRRARYKGQKIWTALLDCNSFAGFIGQDDPAYLKIDSILDLEGALVGDYIAPPYFKYNQYVIFRFSFTNQMGHNTLVVKKLKESFHERIFLPDSYHQINQKAMTFQVDSTFDWDPIQNKYQHGNEMIVTKAGNLQTLPISEAVGDNTISGKVLAGDKVYNSLFINTYMQYMFVFKAARDGHYSDYGWIKKDHLRMAMQSK